MAFSRVKPAGWAFGEILTSAQMNQLDEDHAEALDPVGGGIYNALGAPLQISGDNITLGQGTDTVTVGQTAVSTFDCKATALFDDAVTVGADLLVSGGASIVGNALIQGAGTIQGNATIGNASGDAHSITGTTTVNGPMPFAGAGRPQWKTATLTDASINITPVTANIYYMPLGVMSAGRVLTIDDTNCGNGDWLWIATNETTHGLTINGPGGSPTFITLLQGVSDEVSIMLVRIGGTWRRIGVDTLA